ncbi:TcmI family type II polyketide cyclase [Amycolatopsis balhimycina DSM 5908]|uniref:TcmI family type II polyketide cyclase n=1 Tax=Amycolatopsis balhimycina DSM 5908 TaxID=1081091 RepID=A0A428WP56_AMYBA|nr:TcmI family type II polyketide cyclase [Amycolatopsis balhimycina]RSM44875.1 TcmI family type II polyketide cyclase [Amycolatopsis balhimycina DSM 5908]
MNRTLIVAKADPKDLDRITELWTESDATALPHLVGVGRRTLFSFHGLYFHLIESEREPDIARVRDHPLWHDINAKLKPLVAPYHPSWQGPADAMAKPFYTWPL